MSKKSEKNGEEGWIAEQLTYAMQQSYARDDDLPPALEELPEHDAGWRGMMVEKCGLWEPNGNFYGIGDSEDVAVREIRYSVANAYLAHRNQRDVRTKTDKDWDFES